MSLETDPPETKRAGAEQDFAREFDVEGWQSRPGVEQARSRRGAGVESSLGVIFGVCFGSLFGVSFWRLRKAKENSKKSAF